jgi:glycosyltransferase involved in cell wall biosynthesis
VSRRIHPKPLTTTPTVSVVIPCYNYGHYVGSAVASALDQPGVGADVVVIDDASPDGSGDVVEALAATDERIRFVRHRENRGHIATYNEGMEMVEGDYFVLLSADDQLTPGCLSRAVALMESEPSVGLVYGHPLEFNENVPPAVTDVRSWTVWTGEEWIDRRCRKGSNCIMCPEVVTRGSVQRAIGGYNRDLPHAGDLEMWLRAAATADVGRINGANQAYYRIHDQSMQRTVYAGLLHDLRERRQAFASVLLRPGFNRGDGPALYEAASRAQAVTAIDRVCWAFDNDESQSESIDELLTFAQEAWPDARNSRQWRAMEQRRAHASDRGWWRMLTTSRNVKRDVGDRLRWRRWRWRGV